MRTTSEPLRKAMYVASQLARAGFRASNDVCTSEVGDTFDFANPSMESPVHNERCTPGSEGGARKPTGESRQGAGRLPYATSKSWPHASQ